MTCLKCLATAAKLTAATRGLAVLTSALMLGACSQTAELLPSANLLTADAGTAASAEDNGSELQKATTYWGQEFAKHPTDLKNALNYARNLKAMGEKQKALTVLQQASSLHSGDGELAGEYGRLALELDQVSVAERLLAVADNPSKPDWKIISARGTVLAKRGRYKEAIAFYERAQTLSNNQPSVLNNLAMAYAMSGDAARGEQLLRQARDAGGGAGKIDQNLALVVGLQGRYDEAKTYSVAANGASAAPGDTDIIKSIVRLAPQPTAGSAVPAFTTNVAAATPGLRPQVVDTATTASAAGAWETRTAAAAK